MPNPIPRPTRKVIREASAWNSIGFDEGAFRIKGGTALYQNVHYNAYRNGRQVVLRRLGNFVDGGWRGLRQTNRYVDPETVLEFMAPMPGEPGPL